MTLDSRFIIASDLQQYFVDKTTGEPLSAGTITFFKDQARTTPKDVYILSGSPPNYTYTNIGNEVRLSSVGTVNYNGNDVVLYYFPYEGTPDDSDGTVELYYVVCESSGEVPQFTRQAWPNFNLSGSDAVEDVANYIPNGQFLSHNDLPATDTLEAGEVRAAITEIAQGGWTFERPGDSTAKDIITFEELGYVTDPPGNPPFAFRLQTESADSGDSYKDLRIKFRDVNKFASATDKYTFGMSAINNAGGSVQVQLILIKNYGTGGSATTETQLTTFTIGGSYQTQPFAFSFSFGTNANKTIGDDSYSQLAIRYQLDSEQDISVTNIQLRPNSVQINDYPPTTEAETLATAIAGWMPVPNPDGSDLYLPLKLTAQGLMFDSAEIGEVVMESNFVNYANSVNTITNKLLADGSQYDPKLLSPLGIPYKRLRDYYWSSTLNAPIYGTGLSYLTMYPNGTSAQMRVSTNSAGVAANAMDGTPATTFTFNNIHIGTTNYGWSAKSAGSELIYVIANAQGTSVTATAGTSGFTVSVYRQGSEVKGIVSIETTGPTGLGGKYFTLNFGTSYYIWFKLDGSGSDPAPGGTGIQIDLLSTYSAQDIANVITEALNAVTQTNITFVAASSVTAGSYFNISSPTVNYYVWYKKDNSGTDPAPANKTGIEVDIVSADTSAQVAIKTQIAINQKYFAVPNYQGLFARGWDPTAQYDLDFRWGNLTNLFDNITLGTFELDQILEHQHNFIKQQAAAGTDIATPDDFETNRQDAGGYENRPQNFNVNYAIKY